MCVVLILVLVASSSHHTAQYCESPLFEYCRCNAYIKQRLNILCLVCASNLPVCDSSGLCSYKCGL
jgi:hypothetical protein